MKFKMIDPIPEELSTWIPQMLLALLAKVGRKVSPGDAFGFWFLPGGGEKTQTFPKMGFGWGKVNKK